MGKDGTAQKIVGRVVGRERRHVLDEPRELIRRRLYRVLLGVLSIRRADFGIVRVEVNAHALFRSHAYRRPRFGRFYESALLQCCYDVNQYYHRRYYSYRYRCYCYFG